MKNKEINPKDEKKINKKTSRTVLWVVFAIYCLGLAWVLFLSREIRHGYTFVEYISKFSNFVPFRTIFHYANISTIGSLEFIGLSIWNVIGNLIMLLPLGAMLPCLFKHVDRFWKVVLVVIGTVVTIECAQLLLRVGVVDVDDLILNLSGAMIGYAIIKIPPISRGLLKIGVLHPRREKSLKKSPEKAEKTNERQYTLK